MSKDDSFWLGLAYFIFFFLIFYVVKSLADTIALQAGWNNRYDEWLPAAIIGLSIVIGAVSTFTIKKDKERHEYYLAAIAELRKVTWPTWDDTKKMTVIVVVVVGIFAAILAAFDFGWAWALRQILV